MLLDAGVTSINEELLVILLKISKSCLSKQSLICSELIHAIKILIKNTYADKGLLISELRDKIGKIINIMYNNKIIY